MATTYYHEPVIEDAFVDDFSPVQTWPFEKASLGIAAVVVSYLILVLRILPFFMKNRPPFKLKRALLFYNAFQVALSSYTTFIYVKYTLRYGVFPRRCPQGDDLKEVVSQIWPYFIAKHIDILDTVFFALRKKDNQVSFLHVYHHALMISWAWFYLFYYPTDHFAVVGLINSFVHVVMYAYYWVASLGPAYSKYIWWKKHLTKVQMIQFILVLLNLHYQQKQTPCRIPDWFHNYSIFTISSFFVLFTNFYVRSYVAKTKKQSAILTDDFASLKTK